MSVAQKKLEHHFFHVSAKYNYVNFATVGSIISTHTNKQGDATLYSIIYIRYLLDHFTQLSQNKDGKGEQRHRSRLVCGCQRGGYIKQQRTDAKNHLTKENISLTPQLWKPILHLTYLSQMYFFLGGAVVIQHFLEWYRFARFN